ncbi:AbrB/MazE/SpoVT family DNA-binding domain-containing protein [Bacillus wiedmannii]|uniref:AbrB/MazE/SpoVT family DNA-binding domain-containing protein n=1 Tax=Bacillus wiedmannii TaxID=1890302 RepID=UPI000BF22B67|nr:AbrB/MazE/SpoVT family DNA-binding domain-containing protein [Bacillus wiedmannii]MCU5330659.1 AbrB/MazE/SpoVT family DNA-binding domain-containing protein [Bacillus wiedmannii]PEL82385.1 AbrB family transcriptional regulator [Bacillus wiedmannii]
MKNTGVARKVDELGRVVISVELRRTLGITEGTALDFHVDGENVVLRKQEKSCFVTGKLSEDNFELLDGRIFLSSDGANLLMDAILQSSDKEGKVRK